MSGGAESRMRARLFALVLLLAGGGLSPTSFPPGDRNGAPQGYAGDPRAVEARREHTFYVQYGDAFACVAVGARRTRSRGLEC